MSRRRTGPCGWAWLALLAALTAAPSPARAQRGIDIHLFHPTVDGNGFFAVERAVNQPALTLGLQLTFDFANQPLSAVMTNPATQTARRQTLIDWQLVVHVGIVFGITSWLELVADLPASAQSFSTAYGHPLRYDDPTLTRTGFFVANRLTTTAPPNAGPLDLPIGAKVQIWRNRVIGFGALALMTVPIGDDSSFLGEAGVTFRPTLVGDLKIGPLLLAGNLGAIVRQTVRVVDPYQQAAGVTAPRVLLEVGHELTWSGALGYRPLSWLGLAVEVLGLAPLTGGGAHDTTIEVDGGLQFRANAHLGLFAGAGGNLTGNAARHESFRVFAGLGWTPGGGHAESRGLPAGGGAGGVSGDRDGDGIPDAIDRCPDEPEDRDGFADDDGCPDPDNDHDGIPDVDDRCPDEPEDRDGFEDADGCPDLDNDGDGIPDAIDHCPNEPETRNGIDDADGCPESTGVAPPVELVLPELGFEPGRSTLTRAAETLLDHAADRLAAARPHRVRLEGHTDPNEPARPNATALAQARANVVREYLIKRGVDAERLQAVGYGSARPREAGDSAQARAANRRVEMIVVDQ